LIIAEELLQKVEHEDPEEWEDDDGDSPKKRISQKKKRRAEKAEDDEFGSQSQPSKRAKKAIKGIYHLYVLHLYIYNLLIQTTTQSVLNRKQARVRSRPSKVYTNSVCYMYIYTI
jgi:hypothetical protein